MSLCMPEMTLYHNPRCSKSRQALEILTKAKVTPQIREYMKDPLTQSEIKKLLSHLSIKSSELLRKNEKIAKDLKLTSASEKVIIQAMSKHPELIERPIFVYGKKAVVGRPPENVLELLP